MGSEARTSEARTLLTIMLLLFIIGVWDVIAVSYHIGSLVQVLAESEGFNRVHVSFYPPKNGTLLISYEMFVEPNPLIMGDKYALLRIILCDSTGKILWTREVHKGVKMAVRVATDYVAIDVDEVQGMAPYKAYVIVEKVTWGSLKKLRVRIKHNPYVEPIVYSPITLVIEIFSACLLPLVIALALPQTLIKWCKGARAILLILAMVVLYMAFRYLLYRALGVSLNPINYVKLLLSIIL